MKQGEHPLLKIIVFYNNKGGVIIKVVILVKVEVVGGFLR